jgi:CHAT domain-containing protein/Tfp pilus assembly protein PilF
MMGEHHVQALPMSLRRSLTLLITTIALISTPLTIAPQTIAQSAEDLSTLAWKQYEADQYPAAIATWEKVILQARQKKDLAEEASALVGLGFAYRKLTQGEQSLLAYQQAAKGYQSLGDRASEASTLLNIVIAYRDLAQSDKAIATAEQALKIYTELGDQSGEADAFSQMGLDYGTLSKYDRSIQSYEQSLTRYQQLKDLPNQASILNNLGSMYANKAEYGSALKYHQQALEIYRGTNDRLSEASLLLYNLAAVYMNLRQEEQAKDCYRQAIAILATVPGPSKAEVWSSTGWAYYSLDQYSEAIAAYQKALGIYQATGDRANQAEMFMDIGFTQTYAKQYKNAIASYEAALAILEKTSDRNRAGHAIKNLASVYQSDNQPIKAIELYQSALKIFRSLNQTGDEAFILSQLGFAYVDNTQLELAMDSYRKALQLHRQSGAREQEGQMLGSLADLFKRQAQPELAIAFYKQAVNLYEAIRKDIRQLPREAQEKYTSAVATTYRDLADLLLSQGRIREAQEILDLLKIQETSSYDQTNSAQPTVQLALQPPEQEAIGQFETTIAEPLTTTSLKKLAQSLAKNRDRLIQTGNSKTSAIGNFDRIISNPDTLLIQNLFVNNQLWVIWSSRSGGSKRVVIPITEKELRDRTALLQTQLSDSSSDINDLHKTSQTLYNWLIPAALQEELQKNPKKQLIFSLDHVTRYIPPTVLYDGKQYLTERYQISTIVTTAVGGDRLQPQSTRVLALGTSQALKGFSALPSVATELTAIVKQGNTGIYAGHKYLDGEFTLDRLRSSTDHNILHIATHGTFNPQSITRSALLLGDGSLLSIGEIAKFTNLSRTDLVVLSACETGLSQVSQDGTEISGISGYFLGRGAKSVVASLWQVSDQSTALMMQKFYGYLSQGMTKAEALQKAQLDLIGLNSLKASNQALTQLPRAAIAIQSVKSIDPRPNAYQDIGYAHPFFWAPFILIGNSQ